ncbi:MAG: exo-alpha-sialidase [Acidobacteria bacterium]|nr:exo-alpha-sialidase [Acidobacteriota bacterium]
MKKLLLLWLLLALPVLAQTHQHGTMPAANNADGSFNPYVVADARGKFYLAYVQRTGSQSDVMLRHSTDGVSFSAPVRVNDREGDGAVRNENPPKVAVAPNGDVYVCWASERERWKGDIRFARSTDGGKTFSRALTLNSDAGGAPTGHAFQALAVDRTGKIYVAWIDERAKTQTDRGAEIWLTASTDRGRTFAPDHRVLGDVCECCRTAMQADAAGNLYLTYRTVPHSGPMQRDIILARSVDAGRTFKETVVSHDGWEVNGCPVAGPSFALDPTGKITVIWFMGGSERPGLYYAVSTNNGATFAAKQWLDPQQHLGKHVHAVALGEGRVFVSWDDATEKTFSAWGLLEPQKGLQRRSDPQEGLAYPVVAANAKIAVIAGMRLASHEIAISVESLNGVGKHSTAQR